MVPGESSPGDGVGDMLLTDLRQLKLELDIDPDDASEDGKLGLWIAAASSLIEDYLNRPGLSYKSRTEYYAGTGTQKLPLRSRPVFTTPTIQVFEDAGGYFASASGSFATSTALTYGTDFAVQVDQDDGTSRSGILVKIGGVWLKPSVRSVGFLSPWVGESFGSIKIVYTAGYTVDTLPPAFRVAVTLLVAKLRHILPLGVELTSESYEERSISWSPSQRAYLMGLIKPMLFVYRNLKW